MIVVVVVVVFRLVILFVTVITVDNVGRNVVVKKARYDLNAYNSGKKTADQSISSRLRRESGFDQIVLGRR